MKASDDAAKKHKVEENQLFNEIDQALLQKIREGQRHHELRSELDQLNQTSITFNGIGALAFCALFATLRYAPRLYHKMYRQQGYILDPPPMKLPQQIISKTLAVGKLGVDLYASMWVARWVTERDYDKVQECHAGSYLYNKSPEGGRTFLSKLSYFPPSVGRSIVADDLCPIVQDKLRNVRSTESYELRQLAVFAENCVWRQELERRLRQQTLHVRDNADGIRSTRKINSNIYGDEDNIYSEQPESEDSVGDGVTNDNQRSVPDDPSQRT